MFYQQQSIVAIRIFLTFCCFVFYTSLFSQNIDNQLRITPSLTYKFNKKWKIDFNYRLSLRDDITNFSSSVFQLILNYKIHKNVDVGLGYRYATSYNNDQHRFFANLEFDKKFGDLEVVSRTRYQFSTWNFDPEFMIEFKEPSQYLREKISIQYNIPNCKADIYFASEFFFKLDSRPIKFHRMRYYGGVNYNLKYGNTVGFDIFYEDIIYVTKQDRVVYNIKYNLNINDLLKKLQKDRNKRLKKR